MSKEQLQTNNIELGGNNDELDDIYNNLDSSLVSLANDTVTPETLEEGVTAHNANGEEIVGTMASSELLQQIINTLGITTDSGGAVDAGTVMAKLNALLENQASGGQGGAATYTVTENGGVTPPKGSTGTAATFTGKGRAVLYVPDTNANGLYKIDGESTARTLYSGIPLEVFFNESIVINGKSTSTYYTSTVYYLVQLE